MFILIPILPGVIRLAREGSMRIRRSIRRNSLHRKEDMDTQNQINHNMTSEENLIDVRRVFIYKLLDIYPLYLTNKICIYNTYKFIVSI